MTHLNNKMSNCQSVSVHSKFSQLFVDQILFELVKVMKVSTKIKRVNFFIGHGVHYVCTSNVCVGVLQNAVVSSNEALRRQLSNHWTLIGDVAFIESQIETPASYFTNLCANTFLSVCCWLEMAHSYRASVCCYSPCVVSPARKPTGEA